MMETLKRVVKKARLTQPFNYVATSTLRTLLGSNPAEFVVQHLPKSGVVRGRLPNGTTLRMQTHGDDWIANEIYWKGWRAFEPEMSGIFFELARTAHVMLDIGANTGFYTALAGLANPQGRQYAFEPLERICRRLRVTMELNGLKHAVAVQAAVSNQTGTTVIYDPGTELPGGASLSAEFSTEAEGFKPVPTKVVTIDGFVAEHKLDHVDLIKMDTERTEAEVLQGMQKTLAQFSPDIFCEVLENSGVEEPLMALLSPHGYRYYDLLYDGPHEREKIVGKKHPGAKNYLFSKKSPAELRAFQSRVM